LPTLKRACAAPATVLPIAAAELVRADRRRTTCSGSAPMETLLVIRVCALIVAIFAPQVLLRALRKLVPMHVPPRGT
jgi:hypothetical protein